MSAMILDFTTNPLLGRLRHPHPPSRPTRGRPLVSPHLAGPSETKPSSAATSRRHILTVSLEDYFHVSPFRDLIEPSQWPRFERRLEIGTQRTLDLLDEFGIRATFFVLGWVADTVPVLVRGLSERGNEIASGGYYHRSFWEMGAEFREDFARARE